MQGRDGDAGENQQRNSTAMKRTINIEYTWWNYLAPAPIHPDHADLLDDHAIEHIRNMTDKGFVAGQLVQELEYESVLITYAGWWTYKYLAVEPTGESRPIWRCTWCCKDTTTIPCEHCGNDLSVTDRTKPHHPEWSRYSISEVECKVCDRRGPYSLQRESSWCNETNIPKSTDV
jgi:hypothetical protein